MNNVRDGNTCHESRNIESQLPDRYAPGVVFEAEIE